MLIDVRKYLDTSEKIVLVSQAKMVGASIAILDGAEKKRDELREVNEAHPKECPEDLTEDYRYIAGMIAGLNWILRLPERSMELRENLDQRR